MQIERLFNDAQIQHQKGLISEALKRYERILTINPKHSLARLFKALSLQQLGKSFEALEEAEKAFNETDKHEITFLVNYGIIQKNAGNYDKAATAYEKAISIDPKLKSAQANLGTLYFLLGKLDEAKIKFTELTKTFEDAAPWLNLAQAGR